MKRKLIVAAVCFAAAFFLNVYFSTVVFQLAGRCFEGINQLSLAGCIQSIAANRTHRAIFVCLQIFAALGLCLLLVSRIASSTGKMNKITADIKTPAVAGQKQHGSARWQTKKEIYKNFDVVRLDKNDPVIRELIKHGYDDLNFMQDERGDHM